MGQDAERRTLGADALAQVTGGRWVVPPHPGWRYSGICFHPGRFRAGDLVAVKAASRLGCDLDSPRLELAVAGGVLSTDAAALPDGDVPLLVVDDVPGAIARIAAHVRPRYRGTVVAVTGSVGKTSTANMIHRIMSLRSSSLLNGQWNMTGGVVATVASMTDNRCTVVEVAHSAIRRTGPLLRPDVVVITQVGPAHLEDLGDVQAVAHRKAALIRSVASDGVAVLNRDIEQYSVLEQAAHEAGARIITYGRHPDAAYRLLDYDLPAQRVRAVLEVESSDYDLPLLGEHMAVNSLGAIAACHAVGMAHDAAVSGLATARTQGSRGRQHDIAVAGGTATLIDASYNANPTSVGASLRLLAATAPEGDGRRIAVLGDMLELGPAEGHYHEGMAPGVVASRADVVFLVGPLMRHLADALPPALLGAHVERPEDLLPTLEADLRPGDVVLAQGSHGIELDRVVRSLRRRRNATPAASPVQDVPSVVHGTTATTRTEVDPFRPHVPQRLARLAALGVVLQSLAAGGDGVSDVEVDGQQWSRARLGRALLATDELWGPIATRVSGSLVAFVAEVDGYCASLGMADTRIMDVFGRRRGTTTCARDVHLLLRHLFSAFPEEAMAALPVRSRSRRLRLLGVDAALFAGTRGVGAHAVAVTTAGRTEPVITVVLGAASASHVIQTLGEFMPD